jgi:LacI family transcriptional regulator
MSLQLPPDTGNEDGAGRSARHVLEALERETHEREQMHRVADELARERVKADDASPLLLGVATITWEYSNTQHPIFAGVFDGIMSRTRAGNCDVLLFTTSDRRSDVYLRRCRQSGVDGVILHGFNADDPRVSTLLEARVPCVAVDAVGLAPRLGHVSADNVGGAVAAVRHLHAVGRRRIATIHAPLLHSVGEQRLLGYRVGLEEVGLPARPEYLVPGDFHVDSGSIAMRQLLELEEVPDAVFAASDLMALGAMAEIERAGLRVPDDIAIVGFDDVPFATQVSPRLTTVRQNARGQGTAAAEGVLRMILEPESGPIETLLPVDLIVRESSGAASA